MSRKHFQSIAQAIRENIHSKELREEVARALMPALRESNVLFNQSKFLAAAVGE
jgi:hypothetical protein